MLRGTAYDSHRPCFEGLRMSGVRVVRILYRQEIFCAVSVCVSTQCCVSFESRYSGHLIPSLLGYRGSNNAYIACIHVRNYMRSKELEVTSQATLDKSLLSSLRQQCRFRSDPFWIRIESRTSNILFGTSAGRCNSAPTTDFHAPILIRYYLVVIGLFDKCAIHYQCVRFP